MACKGFRSGWEGNFQDFRLAIAHPCPISSNVNLRTSFVTQNQTQLGQGFPGLFHDRFQRSAWIWPGTPISKIRPARSA
jgi:hypothetical protein